MNNMTKPETRLNFWYFSLGLLAAICCGLLLPGSVGLASPTARAYGTPTWDYVALGDSFAAFDGAPSPELGYVGVYRTSLQNDFGVTVNLTNYGVSGFTSTRLLTLLQTNATVRNALQSAEVITFNIGINDLLRDRADYRRVSCGGADGQDCLREGLNNFRTNWNAIIEELLALRANSSVILRTMDIHYPYANLDSSEDSFPGDGLNNFQTFKLYWDAANAHLHAAARANNIPVAKVAEAFNGRQGTVDVISLGVISPDTIHPNAVGYATMARQLRGAKDLCVAPPVGLVALWAADTNGLDERSGKNATLTGTTFISSINRHGLRFAAPSATDNFSADGSDVLDLNGSQITLETWVRLENNNIHPSPNSTGNIGKTGPDQPFLINFANNGTLPANQWQFEYVLTNSAGTRVHNQATNVNVPADGNFYHLALTYNGTDNPASNGKLYSKGV